MNSGLLFVGLGGALGAILRVVLMRVTPPFILSLPIKILIVNIVGCFALGMLTEIMAFYWHASMNMRHFLVQGLLGGFTTFSAFALEFSLLYEKGNYFTAIFYAGLSVILCLAFFFLGLKLLRIVL